MYSGLSPHQDRKTGTHTSKSDQSSTARFADASKQKTMSGTCYLLGLLFILSCLPFNFFELLQFDVFVVVVVVVVVAFCFCLW